MAYWSEIIVGIITGAFALIGTMISNSKSAALMEYRLKQLEAKQDKHNNVIDRTYGLEKDVAVIKEEIQVANHRIADLEDACKKEG